MINVGIIILAAGNSSRLGRPKQLLKFEGKTLLQHVCNEAKLAGLNPIIVVTGANQEEILKIPFSSDVNIIFNQDWKKGMSTSISSGLKALENTVQIENIIISVCDQPFLSAEIFTNLWIKKNNSNKGIIASSYSGILGTPVLFNKIYINNLMQLTGNDGAKNLLNTFKHDVEEVSFLKGNIDIDTESDYQNLLQQAEKI